MVDRSAPDRHTNCALKTRECIQRVYVTTTARAGAWPVARCLPGLLDTRIDPARIAPPVALSPCRPSEKATDSACLAVMPTPSRNFFIEIIETLS